MASVSRRALGVALLAIAGLLFTQPFVLRSTPTIGDELPTIADPGSPVGLLAPALVAAGAVVLVSGVAATRGRPLAPRWSLAAPAVSVAVGVALGVDAPAAVVSDPALAVSGTTTFVVAGSVVGASLAPVTLGATKGDTVALLAGVVLLLAGVFAAPMPALALVVGLGGGGAAVGLLWALDAETWRP
ncbi:hypothetical protein [Halorubrum sp. DTA98]|uniref:hypothetical protein n=1 Tax=Halorubrum sp. DTA98 TaxID=3402163 RepID=UPI003AACA501